MRRGVPSGFRGCAMRLQLKSFNTMSVAVLSILMLSDAQSNTSQNFSVRGLVFTGTGKLGDFAWMITQPEYQDALFIFNDNEDQFEAHRTSPESRTGPGCTHGGGTAV